MGFNGEVVLGFNGKMELIPWKLMQSNTPMNTISPQSKVLWIGISNLEQGEIFAPRALSQGNENLSLDPNLDEMVKYRHPRTRDRHMSK